MRYVAIALASLLFVGLHPSKLFDELDTKR
jgi:hypothetical protein